MGSTSVHIPDDLLGRLEQAAKRRRVSRNRLIVEACRVVIGDGASEWPEGFFDETRLAARDRSLLRSTFSRWLGDIAQTRRSKKAAPF
ncbi:MAG: ribbon-helix-helix protein, CopG family [Deltaproteobacteria bacterium]|nr:ribbon-helix-helix protein, CopG family [Deltaproteobacteria bacterium]